ncbi:MAG TPA: ATP-binding protein, partial [Bryobacteraceae bacterium]|nr:ATP-binding protein [Bryobacteraceae bacterium]
MDLYTEDLGAILATELYAAVEEFTHIKQPPADRLEEGYLIDFKKDWGKDTIKSVAAFANTFGGILLVGVTEQSGRADEIIGVHANNREEIKTKYASSIASNITPTPSYQ